MKKNEYRCKNCKEVWCFIPEDYKGEEYPTICPHCNMTILEMVKNVYAVGGIREVIYWLKVRYINKLI